MGNSDDITIDDFLELVGKVEPNDWFVNEEETHSRFVGDIPVGKYDLRLVLRRDNRRDKITYKGWLFYGNIKMEEDNSYIISHITGNWEYVYPIDKHRVAEEGDPRLKAKYEEMEFLIGVRRDEIYQKIKDFLSVPIQEEER
jgi:hypothetical protein